ncbi:endonuclease/exonuclease/phosphatase family protein [Aquirufa rosea]|uniref:Endonuclease n=1 Tax=Aquirufa rosea TaxID=2509241 RepID=A0A4Q1C0Y4_9BACT|nr:endonuclease/exonuclease/phosphatase family protein [Aquirufa rosea]RXK50793.1 endonuclease [Aquirufa rosea]
MGKRKSSDSLSKKILSSIIWLGTLPLCLYTLLTYLLSYSLVVDHWLAGFIMMSMPFAQILCLISLIYWIFQRAKRALLPLTVLVFGYSFIQRSIAVNNPKESLDKPIKVLSYNVYGMYSNAYESNEENVEKLKNFMRDYEADIKCFQEFYSHAGRPAYKTISMMKEQYPHYAFLPLKKEIFDAKEKMGLAIFSKYPIIHEEGEQFKNSANGFLLADLVKGKDTIRVINLQLWSMGIRVGKVTGKIRDQDYEDAKKEGRGIIASLRKGFIRHKEEISQINRIIQTSPYPVLVMGDLNETPYGWVYGTLRERMENAFESAGRGFGFTLNRSPYMVRIDNQFYSKEFEILEFNTLRKISFSDHFPIVGSYVIKKR